MIPAPQHGLHIRSLAAVVFLVTVSSHGCTHDRPVLPTIRVRDGTEDATTDAQVKVAPCTDDTSMACVSRLHAQADAVRLGPWRPCQGVNRGATAMNLGDYDGDGTNEVAVVFCTQTGAPACGDACTVPAVAVVDLARRAILGSAQAPAGQQAVYADVLRDPHDLGHPFITGSVFSSAKNWDVVCVFRPDVAADARCGPGFIGIDSLPELGSVSPPGVIREAGGFVQDLDGDGWEDVTLLFHGMMVAVSPLARRVINTLVFDVGAAATTDPRLRWFHDGRNYGTDTAVVANDGELHVVMLGGSPVGHFVRGTYEQEYCGVSRFAAMVSSTPGKPGTRRLAWSHYISFNSAEFMLPFGKQFAAAPSTRVTRSGDLVNGCLHHFSDSRSIVDGREAIVFDEFEGRPVSDCLSENYAVILDQFQGPAMDRWNACLATNAGARGTWTVRALAEADGTSLAMLSGAYVWGASDRFVPRNGWLYLVEPLPSLQDFDLSTLPVPRIAVRAISGGAWREVGTFPLPGRPAIRLSSPQGPRGNGDGGPYAELTLSDIDHDGLDDIQLSDGTWVGWSLARQEFVAKPY